MKNSIFITTNLSKNTGGGNVSLHELNTLIKSTNVKLVLADHEDSYPIPVKSIRPTDHKLPQNEFLWDYLACEKIDPIIRENNIDIVFINGNPFGKTVNHIINYHIANNRKKPKIIVSVPAHDLEESIREHDKLYEKKYHEVYPHMVDPFLWSMQTEHIKKADIIVCPSKYSVEALRKLSLIKDQDVKIIPHGVDLPSQENIRPIPEEFRVGYAGSCLSDKGIIYGIQAWNNLAYKEGLFLYAGHHESIFRDYIFRVQPQNGAKYVILGFMPNIRELYNNISAYIQPSVAEGFGLEILEAMSYGRPIICSDGAGVSELITDGVEGFTFPKRDVNKLMELINYFRNNPSEIKKFGTNARKKAGQYKLDIVEKHYSKLFI
jgi:glycosyltransferase involved in cell wall biosynthesis